MGRQGQVGWFRSPPLRSITYQVRWPEDGHSRSQGWFRRFRLVRGRLLGSFHRAGRVGGRTCAVVARPSGLDLVDKPVPPGSACLEAMPLPTRNRPVQHPMQVETCQNKCFQHVQAEEPTTNETLKPLISPHEASKQWQRDGQPQEETERSVPRPSRRSRRCKARAPYLQSSCSITCCHCPSTSEHRA